MKEASVKLTGTPSACCTQCWLKKPMRYEGGKGSGLYDLMSKSDRCRINQQSFRRKRCNVEAYVAIHIVCPQDVFCTVQLSVEARFIDCRIYGELIGIVLISQFSAVQYQIAASAWFGEIKQSLFVDLFGYDLEPVLENRVRRLAYRTN